MQKATNYHVLQHVRTSYRIASGSPSHDGAQTSQADKNAYSQLSLLVTLVLEQLLDGDGLARFPDSGLKYDTEGAVANETGGAVAQGRIRHAQVYRVVDIAVGCFVGGI